ncbi:hypothetical protein MMC10_005008 [Thelotrema lepadinum]|nr:hypothetical protein [Thelotrema lepadinum]
MKYKRPVDSVSNELHISLGSAIVNNKCDFTIFIVSKINVGPGPQTTLEPGSAFEQTFQQPTDGSGIRLIVTKEAGSSDRFQFEYTIAESVVFYDISLVNGDPFLSDGFSLGAFDESCGGVSCGIGDRSCNGYFGPNDDPNGMVITCKASTSLALNLCSP